jgi:uncharacterized membrane protein
MMDLHSALKLAHILGAAVLFGTGLGIAFFMFMAHRTRNAAVIAATARVVVIADALFTATSVVAQPLTGGALIHLMGFSWREPWIVISLSLYAIAGLCWLPVLWIQLRLRDLAADAARRNAPLPPEYDRLFGIWFALGWPAFLAVIGIFAVMIWKPQL